jgi:hypothetical protein
VNSYAARLIDRLNLVNVPIQRRAYQAANAVIAAVFGGPLRICHVVEFPKCGGSWISNTIRSYVGSSFNDGYRLVGRDEVIQKHVRYRPDLTRVVVTVRDPRDMFVSAYYHETSFADREKSLPIERYFRKDPERPIAEDFAEYLEAKLLHVTHPRFFYSQFLDSWLGRPGVCVVRYEDFLEDAEAQLIRVVRFLERPVELDRIRAAVVANSFENTTRRLYGVERATGVEDNTRFVRKGIVGDWKNHFNERSCQLLEKFEGSSLRRLGYERDGKWIAAHLEESNPAGSTDRRFRV